MKIFGKTFTEFLIEQYRYVLAFVAVVLAVVGYFALIGPELTQVRQFGAVDLQEEKDRLADRQQYLGRLQGMLNAYEGLNQASVASLKSVLPTQEDIPDLFIIVEDLAEQSNLTLSSISINPATLETGAANVSQDAAQLSQLAKSKNLKAFDISITATDGTSYEDFKEFIINIEHSNRLFDLRSMQFTPEPRESSGAGDETSVGSSPYSVNLRTYYIESEEEA